jgi:hypothetical protein
MMRHDATRYYCVTFTYYGNRFAETMAEWKAPYLTSAILNKTNDTIIMEYFEAMQAEINPSMKYINTNRNTLNRLSHFHVNKTPYRNNKGRYCIPVIL